MYTIPGYIYQGSAVEKRLWKSISDRASNLGWIIFCEICFDFGFGSGQTIRVPE
jgi:hypothetical protein